MLAFDGSEKFGTNDIFFIKDRMITASIAITETQILSDGRIDTNWKQPLTIYPNGFWRGYIHNEKHIFLTGTNNLIYHFNGTNWVAFSNEKQPNPTTYSAVWANSGVVVVCDYEYGKIYRGK